MTDDPDLRLSVAGRALRPISVRDGACIFALPPGTTGFRIASRCGVPAEVISGAEDRRRLGVAIGRIILQDGVARRDIPVDHPALTEGWNGAEQCAGRLFRWTDGNAYVPLDEPSGSTLVCLQLIGSLPYWAQDARSEHLAA